MVPSVFGVEGVFLNQITRKASVHWKGEASGSTRTVSTESGILQEAGVASGIPLTSVLEADPPELIAAAHASSFSLALSDELAAIGFTEGEINTTAMLVLEELTSGWTIMKVNLNVVARLPSVTQGEFIDATIRAKTTCLVSRSLRANVSMNAKLEK
ncbi:MAG: OsmC family peroxiredoxin [Saprospiraceae bacterium]